MYNTQFSLTEDIKESYSFDGFHLSGCKFELLNWEEHCVECSPPYCYNSCELYRKRKDGRCVRVQNGIQIVPDINGPLGYGVRCEFRKWAKLETRYPGRSFSFSFNRMIDSVNRLISGTLAHSLVKNSFFPSWLYKHYEGLKRRYFRDGQYRPIWNRHKEDKSVSFLIDCFVVEKQKVSLLVQVDNEDRIVYSQIHNLNRGENRLVINLSGKIKAKDRVFITPLEETNTVVFFRYLDFVDLKLNEVEGSAKPAPKVKVVAWDLDGTLWDGILVNTQDVKIKKNVVEVIRALDRRGILNTIVSKNDYENAIGKLKEFGIEELFLCPAINWGQKSENLKYIARTLNLGIDSFAFVDDNIREREEVKNAIPSVRVFDETEVDSLLVREEFDVPITDESAKRRFSYIAEVSRLHFKEQFSDDYDAFLRSLGMRLTVEKICPSNKERCYELISRSNQLNLSTNRYSEEQFDALLTNEHCVCRAFRCSDKFGDYGIIAFVSLEKLNDDAIVKDLVISCRVAKKKVESAIISALKEELISMGVSCIKANLIKTKKNGPLSEVFTDLPFSIDEESDNNTRYSINNLNQIPDSTVISIDRKYEIDNKC